MGKWKNPVSRRKLRVSKSARRQRRIVPTFCRALSSVGHAKVQYINRSEKGGLNIYEMRDFFLSLGLHFMWDWQENTARAVIHVEVAGRVSALRQAIAMISLDGTSISFQQEFGKLGFHVRLLDTLHGDPRVLVGASSLIWQGAIQPIASHWRSDREGGNTMQKPKIYVTINADGPEGEVTKQVEEIEKKLKEIGFSPDGSGESRKNPDMGLETIRRHFKKT